MTSGKQNWMLGVCAAPDSPRLAPGSPYALKSIRRPTRSSFAPSARPSGARADAVVLAALIGIAVLCVLFRGGSSARAARHAALHGLDVHGRSLYAENPAQKPAVDSVAAAGQRPSSQAAWGSRTVRADAARADSDAAATQQGALKTPSIGAVLTQRGDRAAAEVHPVYQPSEELLRAHAAAIAAASVQDAHTSSKIPDHDLQKQQQQPQQQQQQPQQPQQPQQQEDAERPETQLPEQEGQQTTLQQQGDRVAPPAPAASPPKAAAPLEAPHIAPPPPAAPKKLAGHTAPAGVHPGQVVQAQSAARAASKAQSDTARNALLARIASARAASPRAPQGDSLSAPEEDALAGLASYYAGALATAVPDWATAAARQERPDATAAALAHRGAPADADDGPAALSARVAFAQQLMERAAAETPCAVALHTTWSGDAHALARQLLPWLSYHAALGVSRLYLLYDGDDPAVVEALAPAPRVELMLAGGRLAEASEAADYEAYLARHEGGGGSWRQLRGAYGRLIKQAYGATRALNVARDDGAAWLLSLEADELLHPAGDGGLSIAPELCGAPGHVPALRFMNAEAVPEGRGAWDHPFEGITLFRAHAHAAPAASQPWRAMFKQGHNSAWLHHYANGRSAVRVDAPGVHQAGPHLFAGPPHPRWATPSNARGRWQASVSPATAVLHYAYASPAEVALEANRSGCPREAAEAARRGDFGPARACFALDFELRAFLVASGADPAAAAEAAAAPLPMGALGDEEAAGAPRPEGDRAPGVRPPSARPPVLSAGTLLSAAGGHVNSSALEPAGAASAALPRAVVDFWYSELVMSEGAPFACYSPSEPERRQWCAMRDVGRLKHLLLRAGLLMRADAPAAVVRGHEALLRQQTATHAAAAALEGLAARGDAPPAGAPTVELPPPVGRRGFGRGGAGVVALPPGKRGMDRPVAAS
ncbi:glycosyltransferase-like [Raphidocelis subcapitata]|uniref:Glycosyltransferase-like n=1 Tax=Raphidocelis subcapitata TaxID=307507 RepID=A0A2V0PEU9_9CHLO|nr:glycosyltransferase-like [Raphidocelis subcapitata]|eukprot:GBF98049.1 glycosyltransferase-like [Raphidocelis subcapitata]